LFWLAGTVIYSLSLHDALPISEQLAHVAAKELEERVVGEGGVGPRADLDGGDVGDGANGVGGHAREIRRGDRGGRGGGSGRQRRSEERRVGKEWRTGW